MEFKQKMVTIKLSTALELIEALSAYQYNDEDPPSAVNNKCATALNALKKDLTKED